MVVCVSIEVTHTRMVVLVNMFCTHGAHKLNGPHQYYCNMILQWRSEVITHTSDYSIHFGWPEYVYVLNQALRVMWLKGGPIRVFCQ